MQPDRSETPSGIREVASSSTVRHINRAAILELIRESGPLSRSGIADHLRLSLPTVMRIVDELIEDDLVLDTGDSKATGGRPRTLLSFNGSAYAVIGVDLGSRSMYGSIADLSGTVLHECTIPHKGSPDANRDALINLIEEFLAFPRPEDQSLRGIGIAVPGIVLMPEGVVAHAPSLGWENLPLQEMLTDHFDLPVFVENDINLAALGEWGFGAGRSAHSLVAISIGTGLGGGIIVDGTLLRGFNQAAGEIGFMFPGCAHLGKRYADWGALESLASGTGISMRAHALLKQMHGREVDTPPSAEDVFQAARDGQVWATKVVEDTADLLSIAIGNITALLDPEIIVLCGGVARSSDILLPLLEERLEGGTLFPPHIVASQLGKQASAKGAIMLVLSGTTRYMIVKRVQ